MIVMHEPIAISWSKKRSGTHELKFNYRHNSRTTIISQFIVLQSAVYEFNCSLDNYPRIFVKVSEKTAHSQSGMFLLNLHIRIKYPRDKEISERSVMAPAHRTTGDTVTFVARRKLAREYCGSQSTSRLSENNQVRFKRYAIVEWP